MSRNKVAGFFYLDAYSALVFCIEFVAWAK